jgi:putative oxidoreductase
MSLIFLVSGFSKIFNYSATLEVMQSLGLWGSSLLLPLATAIEIIGGLALLRGTQLRWTSLVLAAYLVPVTLAFHRFWSFSGATRQGELVEFLKNLSIIGGLLSVSLYQRVLDAFTGGTLIELKREKSERVRAA